MNGNKHLRLCALLAVLLLALATLAGCRVTVHGVIDGLVEKALSNGRGNTEGGEIAGDDAHFVQFEGPVSAVEVDWVSGSITICQDDVDCVTVQETSRSALTERQTMVCRLKNGELEVDFCPNSSGVNVDVPQKDLTITLPRGTTLTSLEIENVSSDCTIDLAAVSAELETVSGNCSMELSGCDRLTVYTVSGDVSVTMAETPSKVKYDAVSGGLLLRIPEDASFQADFSTVSGSFTSEIPTKRKSVSYVAGNGDASFVFETVSADVSIQPLN